MKVAHFFNIAQNGYLNAKIQRLYTDIEADSYDTGGGETLWHPAWEDALFETEQVGDKCWHWGDIQFQEPWQRPAFAKILNFNRGKKGVPWQPAFDTDAEYSAHLRYIMPMILEKHAYPLRFNLAQTQKQLLTVSGKDANTVIPDRDYHPFYLYPFKDLLKKALQESRLSLSEANLIQEKDQYFHYWDSIREISQNYDLVVLTGAGAAEGVFLPKEKKVITFEHSTMRDVLRTTPFSNVALQLMYQHADQNIITNGDCQKVAQQMDWKHIFIPHPFDEQKFSPGSSIFKNKIQETYQAKTIFFCPTRHTNTKSPANKRTDKIIYAFQQYLQVNPDSLLILVVMGEACHQIDMLCQSLGLGRKVRWMQITPKRKLVELYRAADIVLDQFGVGSYGTNTIEALSCARPVITYVNPDHYAWCQDVLPLPPIHNAQTVEEILGQMFLLTSKDIREESGQKAREWVEKWHSGQRIAKMHQELYEKILNE